MSQIVQRDFFISYTSADARWAEWIAWQLEEAGYSVILQAWDFRPGANFVSEMERAITNVKRTIAVLSPQYLNALYTQPEWAAAFKRDPKGEQGILIPVRIHECELTGLLGQIIYIDLVGRDEVSASKILLAGVRHERAKPEMAPAFPESVQHTVPKQLSFPGDLPSIWNVPYPRDPLFVGRDLVLEELHSTLDTSHQVALTSSLEDNDPSNIGILETAVEYVYRYQSDYHAILWAHASTRQALFSDFLNIASLLTLLEQRALGQDEMVNAVKRWLETHTHWLLVLEDVQDPEVIKTFIPSLNRGSLLLTTRVPSVSTLFPLVEMDRMQPDEQTLLLQLSRIVGATLRSSRRRLPLGIEGITVGRAQDNQIVLSEPEVSSHHAEILLREQGYWITDVGSTNGTFVNQLLLERYVPYLLQPRDIIRIGNTTFIYEVTDTPSSKLPASPLPATVMTPSDQNVLPPSSVEAQMGEHVGKQFGNYRLVRLIGQGGFAEVYLGEHLLLDTQAAIKVLYAKLARDDIETFRLEARTIARLLHPHIVRVLDFGVEGTTPFLVMDYAPGDTIRRLYPKGTHLPLETVVSYVKQVAIALQYAHDQKVIHRDVKPENMLMGRNGEVLLSDFGIALITQSSRYEGSIDMAGTIAYMAPEQIEAHPRPASDQYSLGIVVYEWLTGDRPFHGSFREIAIKHSLVPPPSLCEQVSTLPPTVEQVVLIALAKDPKQRFGSVLAFATALEQASTVKLPEPRPVVSVSETIDANQSPQPAMASPVIPFSTQAIAGELQADTLSQQVDGEVSADIAAQPPTIIHLSGKEHLPQVEEGRRKAEEERTGHEQEQADIIEEEWKERVRRMREREMAARKFASSAHQTPLPTEEAHSSKPPALRPDAMVAVKPAKSGTSRRFGLLVLAGLVIVALASCIASGWFSAHNASQTGGIHASPTGSITEFTNDAANTGFSADEHILSTTNVPNLQHRQTISVSTNIAEAPVVANGVVYAIAYGYGSKDLYAFNTKTYSSLWASSLTSAYITGLTVANSILYVSANDQMLYALVPSTGALLWTTPVRDPTPTVEDKNEVYVTPPVIAQGIVYVGSFKYHRLYAFNATTGAFLWSASLHYPGSGYDFWGPTIANGIAYIGSGDGRLYAFNAVTGAPLWAVPSAGSHIYSIPAVIDRMVYVITDTKLQAFNATTGASLWVTDTTGNIVFPKLAVAYGGVYVNVGTGSTATKIEAFNATTGAYLWTSAPIHPIGNDFFFIYLVVANGVVYGTSDDLSVGTNNSSTVNDNNLYAFDAANGKLLWTSLPIDSLLYGPAISEGTLYISVEQTGQLYTFSLPSTAQ